MSPSDDTTGLNTTVEGSTGTVGAPAPSLSSISDALEAWKAGCKRRVQVCQSNPVSSPMDENLWFALPSVFTTTAMGVTSGAKPIGDPMCVGRIFSITHFGASTDTVQILFNGLVIYILTQYNPTWVCLQKDFGPLPSQNITLNIIANPACTISITSITMLAWPLTK